MNQNPIYHLIVDFHHYLVLQAQVDACTRLVDPDTKEVIYLVTSEHPSRRPWQATTYIVRYYRQLKRVVCTCDNGLANTCWHRRAAMVAAREFQKRRRAEDLARRQAPRRS